MLQRFEEAIPVAEAELQWEVSVGFSSGQHWEFS
jgi:hypothetical protein